MMIDSYLIKYINDEISLFENNNGNLEILKNRGESAVSFHHNNFWEWFKTKTVYKDKLLSFIVLTDKDQFIVDDIINIATTNAFVDDEMSLRKIQEQTHKGLI